MIASVFISLFVFAAAQDGNSIHSAQDYNSTYYTMDCQEICKIDECASGVMCIVNTCHNPCTLQDTCEQQYMESWESLPETYDCMNGVRVFNKNCTSECNYEDCSDENNGGSCWVETCDDGCNNSNCTVWTQTNDQWYGESCPNSGFDMPNFRLQDVIGEIIKTGKAYEGTIQDVFQTYCAPNDTTCVKTGDAVVGALSGNFSQGAKNNLNGTEQSLESKATTAADNSLNKTGNFVRESVMPKIEGFADMFFFNNSAVKDVLESAANDTANAYPGVTEQQFETLIGVNSTNEAIEMGVQDFNQTNVWDMVEQAIPEDSQVVKSIWNVFKTGLQNSGLMRKDQRNNA